MTYPVEPDFAQIFIGNGATPEVFNVVCGIENVDFSDDVETSEKYRRDCAKPGALPTRSIRVTGKKWSLSGSGVANLAQFNELKAALGLTKNLRVLFGKFDGTDEGAEIGTLTGKGKILSRRMSFGDEGGTAEITIEGEDDYTYTAAA